MLVVCIVTSAILGGPLAQTCRSANSYPVEPGCSEPCCPIRGAEGAWGAGPILMAASCSHSPGRHTAHPGWLPGFRWRSPFACFLRRFWSAHGCHRRISGGGETPAGRQLAGLDVAPQRDQQLAGKCHDHDLADASFGTAGTLDEPATERTVRLEAQPTPCQLHQDTAHPRIAVLADALLTFAAAAVEWCPGKGPSLNKRVARKDSRREQKRNDRIRKSRSESCDLTFSLAE